jgi:hypothetical protein
VLARSLVGLREITPIWYDTGWYVIDAADWQHGVHVASVEVTVYWSAHPYRGNPCVLQNGMVAGRQGAPTPDDVCAARPDPHGTVWIWKMGHSAERPWTTAHTKDWIVSQARADGTVVTVEATSQIGSHPSGRPIYASTPFNIPVDTLVQIATDSQVGMDGPCTHDCTAFTPPVGPHEGTHTAPRSSTHS